jgi:hypothetical protein
MSISAMKQALQALDLIDKDIEWHDKSPTRKFCNQAAHFLRQAIAEAEQPDLARVGEVGIWGDKREWVGLDGDIPGLGLVTEEFYNGMLCAEDILRKRNT